MPKAAEDRLFGHPMRTNYGQDLIKVETGMVQYRGKLARVGQNSGREHGRDSSFGHFLHHAHVSAV